jgi:hypothetical protein
MAAKTSSQPIGPSLFFLLRAIRSIEQKIWQKPSESLAFPASIG